MTTLTDQILARLSAIEATARAASRGSRWASVGTGGILALDVRGEWQERPLEANTARARDHALMHDPTHVLAWVAGMRDIVALHADDGESQVYGDFPGGYGTYEHCCDTCGTFGEYGVPWPCPTLRHLAAAVGVEVDG